MSKVLIDNATISSVLRALGIISVYRTDLIDVDHVALERFSEAVLFSDEIIIPDNYKLEFSQSRKQVFSGAGFKYKAISDGNYSNLTKISHALSEAWSIAYEKDKDKTLFSQYFEKAVRFGTLVFEYRNSDHYLALKSYGFEKDNPLVHSIMEFNEPEHNNMFSIEFGKGLSWDHHKIPFNLKRIASTITWVSQRYIWHQTYAAQEDINYLPHPLRDFFAYDFLNRLNHGSNSAQNFAEAFKKGMLGFNKKMSETLEALTLSRQSGDVILPYVMPLIVKESENGEQYLEALQFYRNTRGVRELREILGFIEAETLNGRYQKHSTLVRDMESIGKNILREKGLEQRYVSLGVPTKIFGVGISGEDLGVKLPIPSSMYKQYFFKKKYRGFIKRLMEELAIPAQMGEIKDRLNSFAKVPISAEGKKIERHKLFSGNFVLIRDIQLHASKMGVKFMHIIKALITVADYQGRRRTRLPETRVINKAHAICVIAINAHIGFVNESDRYKSYSSNRLSIEKWLFSNLPSNAYDENYNLENLYYTENATKCWLCEDGENFLIAHRLEP